MRWKRAGARAAIATAAISAVAGLGTVGAGTSDAAPMPHVNTKNHSIVIDLPRGEWWNCYAYGDHAPFMAYAPGYYQFALGPKKLVFNQFPRGSHVWIACLGSGLPIEYYGPVLTT